MTPGKNWPHNSAPPLSATPRNPEARTEGAEIALISESLGAPLLPWQRYTADVGTEQRPNGEYEYQIVVVSVPRQSGKTTLMRAIGVHRAALRSRDVFYTAQTGKDARERWLDLVKIIRTHPVFSDSLVSLRAGAEQVLFGNRDRPRGAFRAFAPTPESLQGYTPPCVMVDEAFARYGDSGDLLMGAIGPAQITVTDRQIWLVSTMGTAESVWFHGWVDRACEGVARVAHFVWGAAPEHDPYSVEDIAKFHPAVGHELNGRIITAADILSQADRNSAAEYERAYANRRTLTAGHLIDAETWRAMARDDLTPPADLSTVTLTYDVSADRSSATILATWLTDERPVSSVVMTAPGWSWAADAVSDLIRDWAPAAVAAVDNGPAAAVTDDLRRRGHTIVTLPEREYAAACSTWLSGVEETAFLHDGTEALELAALGLVTRPAAVDGIAFSRRHSVGDISPAVAMVAGVWVASRYHTDQTPLIYLGDDVA